MSKSRGNVVDPFDRLATYSVDGLRYYLMKDGVAHSDGSSCSVSFCSFSLLNLLPCPKKRMWTLGNQVLESWFSFPHHLISASALPGNHIFLAHKYLLRLQLEMFTSVFLTQHTCQVSAPPPEVTTLHQDTSRREPPPLQQTTSELW